MQNTEIFALMLKLKLLTQQVLKKNTFVFAYRVAECIKLKHNWIYIETEYSLWYMTRNYIPL